MDLVFGPLPPLHRRLVVVTSMVVGMLSGIWLVSVTGVPALIAGGIGWGLLTGLLLPYVLLHDFRHRPQPVRIRRR